MLWLILRKIIALKMPLIVKVRSRRVAIVTNAKPPIYAICSVVVHMNRMFLPVNKQLHPVLELVSLPTVILTASCSKLFHLVYIPDLSDLK